MYELRKIHPNMHNADGSKVYEKELDVGTFNDLVKYLNRSDQFYTWGKGSDVFVNNGLFCHTDELSSVIGDSSTMTLRQFNEER